MVHTGFWIMILLVISQRMFELMLARRNGRWVRQQGGYEVGRGHYPLLLGVHILFFLSFVGEVFFFSRTPPVWWLVPFVLFLFAQVLRISCIYSLGPYWNTRIFVIPRHPPVQRGPYRFLRHPNYVVVIVELFSLPLIFGAYLTSILFSVVNLLVLLYVRIPVEEQALAKVTPYKQDQRRWIPRFDK